MKMIFKGVIEEKQTILFIRIGIIMTFDEALETLDKKSELDAYFGVFTIDIEDAQEIILNLRDTYEKEV